MIHRDILSGQKFIYGMLHRGILSEGDYYRTIYLYRMIYHNILLDGNLYRCR